MRRLAALIAVVCLLGIAVTSVTWRADAQGDESDLRAQVADLQTRVAALEAQAGIPAGTPETTGSGNTLNGDFLLLSIPGTGNIYAVSDIQTGSFCGGYDDIDVGTDVVVRNEGGDIIAAGKLEYGHFTPERDCLFPFTIVNVPNADFYAIEVGNRGTLTYSFAELEAIGWEVHFSLG